MLFLKRWVNFHYSPKLKQDHNQGWQWSASNLINQTTTSFNLNRTSDVELSGPGSPQASSPTSSPSSPTPQPSPPSMTSDVHLSGPGLPQAQRCFSPLATPWSVFFTTPPLPLTSRPLTRWAGITTHKRWKRDSTFTFSFVPADRAVETDCCESCYPRRDQSGQWCSP